MKWLIVVGATLLLLVAVVSLIGAVLPQSHKATRRAHFRQSPEAIYSAISGPPDWRSDVKAHGTLPNGRWWEEDAHRNKVTFELVEDRPPTRRVVRIADKKLPFGGTWTFDVAPETQGTSVRITEQGEVYNVIFRFMSRFIFGYTATIENHLRDLGRKFGEAVIIEE